MTPTRRKRANAWERLRVEEVEPGARVVYVGGPNFQLHLVLHSQHKDSRDAWALNAKGRRRRTSLYTLQHYRESEHGKWRGPKDLLDGLRRQRERIKAELADIEDEIESEMNLAGEVSP